MRKKEYKGPIQLISDCRSLSDLINILCDLYEDKVNKLDSLSWKSIDTAPKNGESILVRDSSGDCAVVHWYQGWEPSNVVIPGDRNDYPEPSLGLDSLVAWMPLPPAGSP